MDGLNLELNLGPNIIEVNYRHTHACLSHPHDVIRPDLFRSANPDDPPF